MTYRIPMSHRIYLTNEQPRREGDFRYRTHPFISSDRQKFIPIYDPRYVTAQVMLYRWSADPTVFVNSPSIADLHTYLFFDYPEVSKNKMGAVVLQAVDYNPRLLKGKTKDNPKACMTYQFLNREDLMYGLEWMICMWLKQLVIIPDGETLEEDLADLAVCLEADLADRFFGLLDENRHNLKHIDWDKIQAHLGVSFRDEGDRRVVVSERMGERPPPPRDMSKV